MKLLHSAVILVLLQCLTIKPLEAIKRPKSAITLAQDKLVKLYEDGMSSIDQEFAEKSRNLTEHILKDEIIQRAATPLMQKFKNNLFNFLHKYPFYKRYGLYNKLVTIFSDMTMGFYYQDSSNNPDVQYILKLLKQRGYDTMNINYEHQLQMYIKNKLIPEFERYAKKLSKKDIKLRENLLEWVKETKQCQKYDCYDEHFNILINILYTPKDELFDSIEVKLDRINISYAIEANQLMKSVLQDVKLKQLSPSLRGNLTKDINAFLKRYETNNDINDLDDILIIFNNNISKKYYNNNKLPAKDQQLLREIFDKQGYDKMQTNIAFKLNDFIQQDLTKIFEKFRKELNQNEVDKEKSLFQWYHNIKGLKTHEDKMKAFDKLFTLKDD